MHTLHISGLHEKFDKYLATWAHDKFESLLVCSIIRFFLSVHGGGNLFTSLNGSRILGSLGIKWGSGFRNGIDYCENTFTCFKEQFVVLFSVFTAKIQDLFYNLFTAINSIAYFLSIYGLSDEL